MYRVYLSTNSDKILISWFYWCVPFRDCVFCTEITLIRVLLLSVYLDILKCTED